MASINFATREINCKIVYYGPGLSGKTTNLQVIHQKLPKDKKSDMVSLATEQDRTLFFDFLPLDLGAIRGFKTKFQLYTVPGQVYYNSTRKLVLRGVDGVVFVADSRRNRLAENLESLQNLQQNLREYGLKLEDVPFILQYNKRDMEDVFTVAELDKKLNYLKVERFEAISHLGKGVVPTLKAAAKKVIDKFNKRQSQLMNGKTAKPAEPVAASKPADSIASIPEPKVPTMELDTTEETTVAETKAPETEVDLMPYAKEEAVEVAEAPPEEIEAPPSFDDDDDDDDDIDEEDIELMPYIPKK